MSSGARYKFNGSTFTVQTGYVGSSPPQVITGITQANPGVVTSANHGLSNGDVGKITTVVGMTEVNGKIYVVDNQATNTFELASENTTGNTAYVSGGIFEEASFTTFCELTGVTQQDGTSDQIDVTTICSTAKEFETGLSDSGTLQLDYNYAPNGTVQAAMTAAKISGDQVAFKIVFPNSGGTVIMIGVVQQASFTGQVSGVWTGSTTIKLSGPIFVL